MIKTIAESAYLNKQINSIDAAPKNYFNTTAGNTGKL
jgi:hypothetical protein